MSRQRYAVKILPSTSLCPMLMHCGMLSTAVADMLVLSQGPHSTILSCSAAGQCYGMKAHGAVLVESAHQAAELRFVSKQKCSCTWYALKVQFWEQYLLTVAITSLALLTVAITTLALHNDNATEIGKAHASKHT